jgi:hypothetical protein
MADANIDGAAAMPLLAPREDTDELDMEYDRPGCNNGWEMERGVAGRCVSSEQYSVRW